jgi:hypothetical protein
MPLNALSHGEVRRHRRDGARADHAIFAFVASGLDLLRHARIDCYAYILWLEPCLLDPTTFLCWHMRINESLQSLRTSQH